MTEERQMHCIVDAAEFQGLEVDNEDGCLRISLGENSTFAFETTTDVAMIPQEKSSMV